MVWVQPPGTPSVGIACWKPTKRLAIPSAWKPPRKPATAWCVDNCGRAVGIIGSRFDPKRSRYAYQVILDQLKQQQNTTALDDSNTQAALHSHAAGSGAQFRTRDP